MISVSCPHDYMAAMFTREILDRTLKLFSHLCVFTSVFIIVLNCQ